MDIKEIKAVIDLMRKNDLDVFQIESEGFKLKLKRNAANGIVCQPASACSPAAAPVSATSPQVDAPVAGESIDSPMVGTFYRASSPDSPPYVEVGSSVTAESVVCIIEAMKVMNEIKAEHSGKITEVLAENGKPVQFGEPLFRIQ